MDKIKIKVDTLINMFECYLNERWVTLYDKDNEPYHVDLDKKSKNKEKKEDNNFKISKETSEWLKTQPMEKIPSIIEAYKKMEEAKKAGEEAQREKRKKELEEIKKEKDKKDKEWLEEYNKRQAKKEKEAKELSFEEYFKTYYPQYKLSKRSPVYDLARGEWEEAQNK